MPGLFEALGGLVERARGFLSGVFGQAAREEIEWPTIEEALKAGGLELEISEIGFDSKEGKIIKLDSTVTTYVVSQLRPHVLINTETDVKGGPYENIVGKI